MSLFLTLVPIQDVTIPVRSTPRLVALRSVKEAPLILGLNFGISCLKMLRLVSLAFKAADKAIIMDKLSFVSILSVYLFWSCEFLFGFVVLFDCLGFPLI